MEDQLLIKVGQAAKDWFECCVCHHWLVPQVYSCETNHFVCQVCIHRVGDSCPMCRNGTRLDLGTSRFIQKLEFEIPCRNQDDGCQFLSVPDLMLKHLMFQCYYRSVECKISPECIDERKMVQLNLLQNHWRSDHGFDISQDLTEMAADTPVTFSYVYGSRCIDDFAWAPRRLQYKGKVLLLFVAINNDRDCTVAWISSMKPVKKDTEISYNCTISAINKSTNSRSSCLFENLKANGILIHSCDELRSKPHASLANVHLWRMDPKNDLWPPSLVEGDDFSVTIALIDTVV